MHNYLICSIKPWHTSAFAKYVKHFSGNWRLITEAANLRMEFLVQFQPRYIFFPHWSWLVPRNIVDSFECVCFHSSDVPYGRGGSPIQNLVIRGHKETMITALRMVEELDAGPVYLKKPLSLEGRAQEIYERSALTIVEMMKEIAEKEPAPIPQSGEPVVFKRRKESDNQLPQSSDLQMIYNHIRMLDAETYPCSYLTHGNLKLEFSHAQLQQGKVVAQVEISLKND